MWPEMPFLTRNNYTRELTLPRPLQECECVGGRRGFGVFRRQTRVVFHDRGALFERFHQPGRQRDSRTPPWRWKRAPANAVTSC